MLCSRLDVHAHFLPAFYREALVQAHQTQPDGIAALPDWSVTGALRMMDKLRVAAAILSISSPGVHFGDDAAAATLARRINEEGTRLRQRYPGRFGLFAVTPLPNVPLAIAELVYALDQLGAEGVVVTSNHRGVYHGDPRLDPFYAELNRRKAAMFIHPTSPSCAGFMDLALGFPRPMLEFTFETTRSVSNLILAGVTRRFPDIRIIVPHAGAALTVVAGRVDGLASLFLRQDDTPRLRTEMRRLYFDLAGTPLPEQLLALREIADPEHILYGSDCPFTPDAVAMELSNKLDGSALISDAQQRTYMFENALKLFPAFVESFHEQAAP